MHRLLVVVAAQHHRDAHVGERAEDLAGVLEAVALGELALHRVVVHHDHPRVVRARRGEVRAGRAELRRGEVADDRDVPQVPGERAAGDAVRGVQADEGDPRHAEHRLELGRDVLRVVLVLAPLVAEAERRVPPGDVVVAGDDDHLAHPPRVAQEHRRPLELPGARALRQVARDGHHVEPLGLHQRLDRLDLRGDGRAPEVEVGEVEDPRHPRRRCSSLVVCAAAARRTTRCAAPGWRPTSNRQRATAVRPDPLTSACGSPRP
ncbi:MAG: hypothetical protein AVDCRST_MAG38-1537 [uncultured Solirubrobacteraceae bacterium]|uniref:Uncharacterized protein n=1 Tax=uncultured Solirubrobacteraceae bacterium TaxID=1162706 RepID=A0A6J4RI66_9ACTN|nr:MAG: hypothetical protein AVDCRST_MAG38-1537 [uncultured Solirubrobacteraceae bacterium]